jgi:hypothetical protein
VVVATKNERRSPLKDLPVRQAGQSLREERERVIEDRFMPWLFAAAFACFYAAMQWVILVLKTGPMPWFWSMTAAITVVVCWRRFGKIRKEIKSIDLGMIGERAVGQFLEEKLRPLGAQVLHDIPSDRGNIDHVVIHTSGIYTIETKTHSKPMKGQCIVKYDGENISVNGFTPDRDPIIQAQAEATALHKLLESSTGKRFKVQPVVLYPGWYVTATVQWPEVWVQNQNQFPTTLQYQKPFIPNEDVTLATYHLKRYVISETEQRAQ